MVYPIDIISSWIEGDELVEIIIEHKPGIDETKERRSPKPVDPEQEPPQPTNAEILTKIEEVLTKVNTVSADVSTVKVDVAAVKVASTSTVVEKAA